MDINKVKVLISGGGTGGHISPGIALYEEFKEKGISASILTGTQDKDYPPLNDVEKKDIFYYRAPSLSKNKFFFPIFIINFLFSILKAIRIIKKLQINKVIGMGGFVSAPALVASILLKIPVYLCEQNSVPGRVTSLFSKYAENIFTTFNITKKYLKETYETKIYLAGNPIRKNILLNIDKEGAKNFFYLKHCKKILLTIGGSQGAFKINEVLLDIKKKYSEELKDVGIIWITGEYSYKKFKEAIQDGSEKGSIYLSPFIENIGLAYKASDIALSRSGSGAIMEFAAVGLPSILIPYPYAASNHQEINADIVEKAGAAVKINDEDANPENIGSILIKLINNSTKLNKMSNKALELSMPNASENIVNKIIKGKTQEEGVSPLEVKC